MRITRIELFKYKPFLHNEVELFEMDMPSNIQNIIGTNGSGKTSLLRELNPKPAVRTDYGDCGYKKIKLTHANSEYVLSSDFSNLSSPHSFVKDLEELNSSGTTAVQDELVFSHLGYTNQVHNICYGSFPLSKMQVGTRKTYLLTAHPCQMKLILDDHKKVNSALRACRDNLSMLHERRASLASQLIDESVKASLVEENKRLENELGSVIDSIHQLNNQKTNIQKELQTLPLPGNIKSRREIISLKSRYVIYYLIPRDLPIETCRNSTTKEIAILATRIENLSHRARELTLEIDKYEQHIKQNDAKGALDLIEASISTLASDINELEQRKIDNPFDSYVLEKLPEQIGYLTDLISFFIGYNAPIPSLKEVHKLKEKLDYIKTKKNRVDREESSLLEEQVKYGKLLKEILIDNIPNSCKKCILFQKYNEGASSAQSQYDSVTKELQTVQLRQKRYEAVLTGRSEQLSLYQIAVPRLQKISDYFSENRYLLIPLKDLDIIQTLRRNPSAIVVRIQNHFNLSQGYYDLRKKKESLDKLILEQEKLKTPSEFGQQFLEQMVIEKHSELETIREEYSLNESSLREKKNFLDLLNSYEIDLTSIQREYEQSKSTLVFKTLEHDKQMCDLYLTHLSQIKYQIVSRLTEIDRILREQDSITARYRDEIMVNIEKITLQEKEFAELEKALSPTLGIPHKYMVQFLNDLFTDANIFMSEVFSYPLEFILLDENTTLDYKFKMLVGDVPIPDISDGSEAQMEMANFAFNLAMSIQREQSQYGLMLDEVGRTFDEYHKQKLVEFLRTIVDDGLVSQLFLINHHATINAGLLNSDTVVLNSDNIVVPEVYNEHVHMEKY